jgi:hypothetical protein
LASIVEKKSGNSVKFKISSNCPYHYEHMQYNKVAISTPRLPCSNVPIQCHLCPPSISGDTQTIWKYNGLYHLVTEHSNNGKPPEIPGELLVKLYIHKQEETALNIQAEDTERYRRENEIPDSDGLAMMMGEHVQVEGQADSEMRGRQKEQDQRQCPQCHPYPLISISQKEPD